MIIVKTHYKDDKAGAELINALACLDDLEAQPLFLCIGSDHHILDCLGPLTGTMLKGCAPDLKVYGTLERPLHARNLVKEIREINKLHEGRIFVAIDASVGDEEEIGIIQIRDGSLLPGRAYAKNLPAVGQYSITGVVDVRLNNPGRINNRPGLGHVYHMAKLLSESIGSWYAGKNITKPDRRILMKKLMIGNAAIARGAYEAGATVATAYPGTPSTEIVSGFAEYEGVYAEWAPNEKVAMEVGAGASIGGARTLVAMKHVGVNVAADPLYTFAYTGVTGGLVIISADDPGMHSSQNEQDNRGYGRFAKLPVVEPSDSQEALDFTRLAFDLSEEYDSPVMLRITTRLAHSQTMVEEGIKKDVPLKDYKKNAVKYVMLPGHARMRHVEVEKRMLAMQAYAETSPLNRVEWGSKDVGIITSGVAYQYVKEVLPGVSVLKLGLTNPLPKKLIQSFAEQVDRLIIIEELEPVIEEQVKSWGIKVEGKELFTLLGEYSPEMIETTLANVKPALSYGLEKEIPARPPLMCPGCPHRGVFHILRKMKLTVMGDIGCYTLGALSPLEGMDACICMGASIGSALGMEKARGADYAGQTVAVIGDSTFVHSGITGLIDVVYNQGTSTVIILDNDTTAMTGHQEHPATGMNILHQPTNKLDIEALVRAIGIKNVRVVDPLKIDEFQKVLEEELKRREPSVIITKRPCVLLNANSDTGKYYVDEELCKGCKLCLKVGCSGVYFIEEDKKAVMHSSCVACGLCPQICTFDAIKKVEG